MNEMKAARSRGRSPAAGGGALSPPCPLSSPRCRSPSQVHRPEVQALPPPAHHQRRHRLPQRSVVHAAAHGVQRAALLAGAAAPRGHPGRRRQHRRWGPGGMRDPCRGARSMEGCRMREGGRMQEWCGICAGMQAPWRDAACKRDAGALMGCRSSNGMQDPWWDAGTRLICGRMQEWEGRGSWRGLWRDAGAVVGCGTHGRCRSRRDAEGGRASFHPGSSGSERSEGKQLVPSPRAARDARAVPSPLFPSTRERPRGFPC